MPECGNIKTRSFVRIYWRKKKSYLKKKISCGSPELGERPKLVPSQSYREKSLLVEKYSKRNTRTTAIWNICTGMLVLTRRWIREKLITILPWSIYVINIIRTYIYIYIYVYIYINTLRCSLHLVFVPCPE